MKHKEIVAGCISLLANVAILTAPHAGSVQGWNTIMRTFKSSERAQASFPAVQEHADGGLL